ncbi:type I-F CRISPR-associated protein Csy2 [Methylotuvimicrobium sp.]|uniref:type I-F CRISPR-associated protein Csy2 n=1 Tax=Methylotuvimicrobium sp. TaxID=2822413 RepID=UPI003D64DD57
MSQYILINRIQVQNANAIAGFTWGFPAVTHFLGFTHNLLRKLHETENLNDIGLNGCAVVSHKQQVHTYKPYDYQFTQSRNPPFLKSHDKAANPPVIEEGKMNMTVSLLIGCEGNIGNRQDAFIEWLENACMRQRLAGGTILKIGRIEIFDTQNKATLRTIKRRLLPGFLLTDRSEYLENHHQTLQQNNPETELIDAWFDFIAVKQQARPKSNLITEHLANLVKTEPESEDYRQLIDSWTNHRQRPYQESELPECLKSYFAQLQPTKSNKKLLSQWQDYCTPTEKTEADWEYIAKPEAGYLVPIMTGYKAISEVYDNEEVANTRDHETPVCFVESVHSVGEWLSVHRLQTAEELQKSLWHYHHEKHWYLCKQYQTGQENNVTDETSYSENPEDDLS